MSTLDNIALPYMGTAETANPREELRETVKRLRERVDEEWQQCSEAQRADETKNVVRDRFDELDVEEDLEAVCTLAQTIGQRTQAVQSKAFRKWIIGKGESNSRSKILATILFEGDEYLLEIWPRLVERMNDSHRAFSDGALPYTSADVSTYFGNRPLLRFWKGQYKFCPVHLSRLDVNFDDTREALRNAIYKKATIRCTAYDEHGAEEPQGGTDRWCPALKLHRVFDAERARLKDLYLGWRRIRQPNEVINDPERLRLYYEDVLQKADRFCDNVVSRERILATLIFSAIWSRSPAWNTFMEHCHGIDGMPASQKKPLTDDMLPMQMSDAESYFGSEGEGRSFYSNQLQFCPIQLEQGKEVDWNKEYPPILPIHERAYIDGGFYGKVYRVNVAAGYFNPSSDTQLAMKVIEGESKFRYTEWRLAQKVMEQDSTKGGIMVPIAIIRWHAKVYIFMHLAYCNLETLMRGKRRRRRSNQANSESIQNMTKEDQEMERICEDLVPTDFGSRLKRLRWMEDMAEALRELHKTLRNEKDQMRRGIVLHGDVKTANILYTRKEKHPLQLSDFGISMFMYAQQHAAGEDEATESGSSSRNARSQLHLSSKCPNFPPEAEKDRLVGESADIWAFGLVFADFVAWISGGPQALSEFQQARDKNDEPYSDKYRLVSFYRGEDTELKVKDGIEKWFANLISTSRDQTNEEKQTKRLYENCWYLLKHGLLRCDPKDRVDADDLCIAIRHIVDREPLTKLEKLLTDSSAKRNTIDGNAASSSLLASGPTSIDVSISPQTSASSRQDSMTSSISSVSLGPQPSSSRTEPTQSSSNIPQIYEALRADDANAAAALIDQDTNIRWKNKNGDRLLHFAVLCTSTAATEKILRFQPSLASKQNDNNESALHWCAKTDLDSAFRHAELIIQADPGVRCLDDHQGKSALAWYSMKRLRNKPAQAMINLLRVEPG